MIYSGQSKRAQRIDQENEYSIYPIIDPTFSGSMSNRSGKVSYFLINNTCIRRTLELLVTVNMPNLVSAEHKTIRKWFFFRVLDIMQ